MELKAARLKALGEMKCRGEEVRAIAGVRVRVRVRLGLGLGLGLGFGLATLIIALSLTLTLYPTQVGAMAGPSPPRLMTLLRSNFVQQAASLIRAAALSRTLRSCDGWHPGNLTRTRTLTQVT